MADSYTGNLRIVQQVNGENAGVWGDRVDAAFEVIEDAISDVQAITLTATTRTLSIANNAADEARAAVLVFSGSPGGTCTVTIPDADKVYAVRNASDQSIILTRAAGGTTLTIIAGDRTVCYVVEGSGVFDMRHPSLAALVGLVSAADTLPYFTGTNSWAVTTLTSFARTILDDASGAAVLTTIGGANLTAATNTFTGTLVVDAAGVTGSLNVGSDQNSGDVATVSLRGHDAASNDETYAQITTTVLDPTNGQEDGVIKIRAVTAGALSDTNALHIGNGITTSNSLTGQGAGTLNAEGYYANNAPFPNVVLLTYQQIAGTNGGTSTAGAWTKYPLNTKVQESGFAVTLSSSVVTLGAGSYLLWGEAFFDAAQGFNAKLRVRNTTAGTTIAQGTQAHGGREGEAGVVPTIMPTVITLAGSTNIELQYWVSVALATTGLGVAISADGEAERYGGLTILKLA